MAELIVVSEKNLLKLGSEQLCKFFFSFNILLL